MPIKHQTESYRVIKGEKLMNYCDLIMGDAENNRIIDEAKADFKTVRKIKVGSFYRLFVSATFKK